MSFPGKLRFIPGYICELTHRLIYKFLSVTNRRLWYFFNIIASLTTTCFINRFRESWFIQLLRCKLWSSWRLIWIKYILRFFNLGVDTLVFELTSLFFLIVSNSCLGGLVMEWYVFFKFAFDFKISDFKEFYFSFSSWLAIASYFITWFFIF